MNSREDTYNTSLALFKEFQTKQMYKDIMREVEKNPAIRGTIKADTPYPYDAQMMTIAQTMVMV